MDSNKVVDGTEMSSNQDPKASTTMGKNDINLVSKEKDIVKSLTSAKLNDIQLNDMGWTSRVYIVNDGKYVFKFPRMAEVKKEYIQEIKIYKLLEQLDTHLQVPKLRWTHEKNDYFGYEGIVGKEFATVIKDLGNAQKQGLGRNIGEFLKQLHKLNLDDPHVMSVEKVIREAQEKYACCKAILQSHLVAEEVAKLDLFMNQFMPSRLHQLGEEAKLCHGDLGYWNMILKDDGSLGVIDFGDIGYYDYSVDFSGLKDRALLDGALEAYGDDAVLREKVEIRQRFIPFFDLQYFGTTKNQEKINETLAVIKNHLLSL